MIIFKVERFDGNAKVDFYYEKLEEAQKHFNYFKEYDFDIYKKNEYDFLENENNYSFEIYTFDYEYSVGASIIEIEILREFEKPTLE